jgi:hypothetical protein
LNTRPPNVLAANPGEQITVPHSAPSSKPAQRRHVLTDIEDALAATAGH